MHSDLKHRTCPSAFCSSPRLPLLASARVYNFSTTCSSLGIADSSTCSAYTSCDGMSTVQYDSSTSGGTSCVCGGSVLNLVCTEAAGQVRTALTRTSKTAGCPATDCDCRAAFTTTARGRAVRTLLACYDVTFSRTAPTYIVVR